MSQQLRSVPLPLMSLEAHSRTRGIMFGRQRRQYGQCVHKTMQWALAWWGVSDSRLSVFRYTILDTDRLCLQSGRRDLSRYQYIVPRGTLLTLRRMRLGELLKRSNSTVRVSVRDCGSSFRQFKKVSETSPYSARGNSFVARQQHGMFFLLSQDNYR